MKTVNIIFKEDKAKTPLAYISLSRDTLKSGVRWAKKQKGKGEVITFPFSGRFSVKLLDLEVRGQGGRAYKVMAKLKGRELIFDLRESELLNCILNHGIDAGGLLRGEFEFGSDGSQAKILSVGSDAHRRYVDNVKTKGKEKIKNSELVAGHTYEGISEKSTFIGFAKASGKRKMLWVGINEYDDGTMSLWATLKSSHSYRQDLGEADALSSGRITLQGIVDAVKREAGEEADKDKKSLNRTREGSSYFKLFEKSYKEQCEIRDMEVML